MLVTNHADARIMPLLRAELEGLGLSITVNLVASATLGLEAAWP